MPLDIRLVSIIWYIALFRLIKSVFTVRPKQLHDESIRHVLSKTWLHLLILENSTSRLTHVKLQQIVQKKIIHHAFQYMVAYITVLLLKYIRRHTIWMLNRNLKQSSQGTKFHWQQFCWVWRQTFSTNYQRSYGNELCASSCRHLLIVLRVRVLTYNCNKQENKWGQII